MMKHDMRFYLEELDDHITCMYTPKYAHQCMAPLHSITGTPLRTCTQQCSMSSPHQIHTDNFLSPEPGKHALDASLQHSFTLARGWTGVYKV